jgi:hypothetical protein
MTGFKTRAAEALTPMLDAFHLIDEKSLQAVWHVYTEGSLDRLALDFGRISLMVAADENDDSLDVTVVGTADLPKTGGVDASHLEPWKAVIGKCFGWGWITVNQQGYCDGLLLSFGGIVPQIALNVIASSIKVATITAAA